MFIDARNEQNWLTIRKRYITASDAANYCGVNPYDKDGAITLWAEKTGIADRKDIGNNPAVIFGKEAEPILRQLFLARHPELRCEYNQFGLYVSNERPFLAATLDGLLFNKNLEEFILEIKTGTARNLSILNEWQKDGVPLNYYCQGLHQLYCKPQAKGVWFFGFIQSPTDEGFTRAVHSVFETYISRDDPEVQKDMKWLLGKADYMHQCIEKKVRPLVA